MRLFVAVELPEAVRGHLVRVQSSLRQAVERAAWARGENLHLTLKFLGEVEDDRVPAVCAALREVSFREPLWLRAEGVQCFPPHGPVRIITAAMAGEIEGLVELQGAIERICLPLGFAREERRYRPHVTLARARRPLPPYLRERLSEAAASLWPGPAMSVERFVLMQSELKSDAAKYVPLARFP